jgi:hypothetical protein
MRILVAPMAALVLGGCGHMALFNLAKPQAAASPASSAAPVCPGSLSADIQPEPQLPAGAGFPAPTDAAASAAVALYGTWLHSWAVWARQGWARAADAKAYCSSS